VKAKMEGALPIEGIDDRSTGLLVLSCEDEARVEPAPPEEVPAGANRADYRRIVLRGAARVVREGKEDAPQRERDLLEADTISMLLVTRPRVSDDPFEVEKRSETVPMSFLADGKVRLGETRLSGTTERLYGQGLDGREPRVVAEGAGTDLVLAGFGGSVPFAGTRGADGGGPGAPGESDGGNGVLPAERTEWELSGFSAEGDVDFASARGPTGAGLAAALRGSTVTYDEGNLAILGEPAHVTVLGTGGGEDHALTAGRIDFSRSTGTLRAVGDVLASVHLDRLTTAGGFTLGSGIRSIHLKTDRRIVLQLREMGIGIVPQVDPAVELDVTGPLDLRAHTLDGAAYTLRCGTLRGSVRQRTSFGELGGGADAFSSRPNVATGRGGSSGRAAAARPARTDLPDAFSSRWALRTDDLTIGFWMDGTPNTVNASGRVRLDGDQASVRADRLEWLDRTKAASAWMTDGGEVEVLYGPSGARSRARAPRLEVTLAETGLSRVHAQGPLSAVYYRGDPKRPGFLQRLTISSDEPLDARNDLVEARGWVVLRMEERDAPTAPWGKPMTLWTEHVRVEGSSLLNLEAASLDRIVAEGPKTSLESDAGASRLRAWGDRFDVDWPAQLVTATGSPERPVLFQGGKPGEQDFGGEQTKLVFDLKTMTPTTWRSPRFVVPREAR
jgi:hypothetical protein